MRYLLAAAFLLTVPTANWLIANVGTTCLPDGPCLIPIAPGGLMAPSGVLMIGIALVLRDLLQEAGRHRAVLFCIVAGALVSVVVSPAPLALASAAAFALSESLDWLIYSRLRQRGMATAVAFSGIAGAILDSLLFSALAFGTISFAPGLILAKVYASMGFAAWLAYRRASQALEN